jgi:hypothetical protein
MPQCAALYCGDCRGRGIFYRICEGMRDANGL